MLLIAGKTGCIAPYCVVEMDEPPQKNQTAFKKDSTSPQWEEHFLLWVHAKKSVGVPQSDGMGPELFNFYTFCQIMIFEMNNVLIKIFNSIELLVSHYLFYIYLLVISC